MGNFPLIASQSYLKVAEVLTETDRVTFIPTKMSQSYLKVAEVLTIAAIVSVSASFIVAILPKSG